MKSYMKSSYFSLVKNLEVVTTLHTTKASKLISLTWMGQRTDIAWWAITTKFGKTGEYRVIINISEYGPEITEVISF